MVFSGILNFFAKIFMEEMLCLQFNSTCNHVSCSRELYIEHVFEE